MYLKYKRHRKTSVVRVGKECFYSALLGKKVSCGSQREEEVV